MSLVDQARDSSAERALWIMATILACLSASVDRSLCPRMMSYSANAGQMDSKMKYTLVVGLGRSWKVLVEGFASEMKAIPEMEREACVA